MKTVTAIIRDNFSNGEVSYRDPLIYTVKVNDPKSHDEVLHAVSVQRALDVDGSISELDLDLLMVFEGDLTPVADYRE